MRRSVYFIFCIASYLLTFSATAQKATRSLRPAYSFQTNLSKDDSLMLANPKEALVQIDESLEKATKEDNGPEIVKLLINRTQCQLEISRDSFPALLQQIGDRADKTTNKTEKCVLRSLLAELYSSYYTQNVYLYNERKNISGEIPVDINEWSGHSFIKKIAELTMSSLEYTDLLKQTPISDYSPVLISAKNTEKIRPTLFDLLAYRAITLYEDILPYCDNLIDQNSFTGERLFSPVNEFMQIDLLPSTYQAQRSILNLYQQILQFHQNKPQSPAFILCDLDRLRFAQTQSFGKKRAILYRDALNRILRKYSESPYSTEIVLALSESDQFNGQNYLEQKTLLTICEQTIQKFPDYQRADCVREVIKNLTSPNFSVELSRVIYPNLAQNIPLTYKNIKSLLVELYRRDDVTGAEINRVSKDENLKEQTPVYTNRIELTDTLTLVSRSDKMKLPPLTEGVYTLRLRADTLASQDSFITFGVSKLFALSKSISENNSEIWVVDAQSGKPIHNARVNLFKNDRQLIPEPVDTVYTNKLGLASADQKNITNYQAQIGDDVFAPIFWIYKPYTYSPQNTNEIKLTLFTDRSVYRPGQTVLYSGIAYRLDSAAQTIIPSEKFTIRLYDVNGNEISSQQVTSDEYGSFAGSFVLPSTKLTGNFRLEESEQKASCFIEVAEYKRPTFEVTFDPIKGSFNFGKIVTITGNATSFAGVKLGNATVKYTITRRQNWFRMWPVPSEQVAEGSIETNDTGKFLIKFVPEKKEQDIDKSDIAYDYEVTASVVSLTGETQEGSTLVSVGDSPLYIRVSIPNFINKNEPAPLSIAVNNLMGEPVSAKCRYILYSLYDNKELNTDMLPLDSMGIHMQRTEYSFESGNAPKTADWKKYPSGAYRLIVQATDEQGRVISEAHNFILYSPTEKRPPVLTYQWAPLRKYSCKAGDTALVIYGTSDKDVSVLYELYDGNTRLECREIKIGNKNVFLKIPYKANYGDLLTASLSFVKKGQFFHTQITIIKEKPDTQLKITSSTFRDKLTPGSGEEWSFSVKDALGKPVTARFMAEMFDASLNTIEPHAWYFKPEYRPTNLYILWNNMQYQSYYSGMPYFRRNASICEPLKYDRLNIPAALLFSGRNGLLRTVNIQGADYSKKYTSVAESFSEESNIDAQENSPAKENQKPSFRQNFNETAFFYPQLLTDENGNVSFHFTVPESNTQWDFMALAYTKDLYSGSLNKTVVSQKPLMVLPNVPRFIRQGDDVNINTLLSNTGDSNLQGSLIFELFNPYTDSVTVTRSVDFLLSPKQSKPFNFNFTAPDNTGLSGFRVRAITPVYSDGEQHLLPILPSQTLITESLPFSLNGNEENKRIELSDFVKKQSKSSHNYRMTLEYSNNPTWYAVQALPGLQEIDSENATRIMSSFYTNVVSSGIARMNPKIESAIRIWQAKGSQSSGLISNLEKNESLKSILLSETPWVMEATNSTERMQSLARLFDTNRNEYLQKIALDKLRSLQSSKGGWSWFKEMKESPFITLNILADMAKLTNLNMIEFNEETKEMQIKALNYLDNNMASIYDKEDTRSRLTSDQVLYLYVRSSYRDIPINGSVLNLHKKWMEQLRKEWIHFSLYDKAIGSMALQQYGFGQDAKDILKSLRSYATQTDAMGMFWQNNRSSYSSTNNAILAHTAIMCAFKSIDPKQEEISEMKRWLLLQKQTQDWGSIPSTVDAIHAILYTGSDWLDSSNENTQILWGGNPIKNTEAEALTGYIQVVKQGESITPKDGVIQIKTTNKQPSWGALYWQYFDSFANIKASSKKNGITIDKKLFIEKLTPKGKEYIPLNQTKLTPGDQVIVRLTITTDRDLEFVHLKDQRAACQEPTDQLSNFYCKEKVCYYQENKDAVTNLFFDFLPKGSYVFDYEVHIDRLGTYNSGISTIQCLYAPQFSAHTGGNIIIIK